MFNCRMGPEGRFHVYSVDRGPHRRRGPNARITKRGATLVEVTLIPGRRFVACWITDSWAGHVQSRRTAVTSRLCGATPEEVSGNSAVMTEVAIRRVASLRPRATETADVYDITVDEHHNSCSLMACSSTTRSTATRRLRCATMEAAHADRDGDAEGSREEHRRDAAELRRDAAGAGYPALGRAEPPAQRRVGHRGRHGHRDPAAQPDRDRRRARARDRQARGDARRDHAARQGTRLPDGRHHLRLPRRARLLREGPA